MLFEIAGHDVALCNNASPRSLGVVANLMKVFNESKILRLSYVSQFFRTGFLMMVMMIMIMVMVLMIMMIMIMMILMLMMIVVSIMVDYAY